MNNNGDLRIWWIPQVPGVSFYFPVESLKDAAVVYNALADYDNFQFENNIKPYPTYSNAGGLQVFDDGEWYDWGAEDGADFSEVMEGINLLAKEDVEFIANSSVTPEAVDRHTLVRRINECSEPLPPSETPGSIRFRGSVFFEIPDFLIGAQAILSNGQLSPPLEAGWRIVTDDLFYTNVGDYDDGG